MEYPSHTNVFSGPTALRDFLNPDNQPPLPLVELPANLNPFASDGVRIYAKLMNFLPLANIKSLPAFNMLLEKEASGELVNVSSLIENSSGNTVFSLGILARLFGIEKTKAIVSHEVSHGKLQLLRFFGVDISVNEEPICPDPSDKESGIYKAREIGQSQNGWWNPGQYDNEANPKAHERWTGPQIWRQTNGKLSVFCTGLGTTGTIVGAGGYLKRQSSKIKSVGVVRKPNNPVPGVRTQNLLNEIAFPWNECADAVVEIGTKESFEQSLRMCRQGVLVGPSSGFAFAGLLNFLRTEKKEGRLERLKNDDGGIVAVFICPDSPFPYVDEYFEYLDASWFADIENEHLLRDKLSSKETSVASVDMQIQESVELTPQDAFEKVYDAPTVEAWRIVDSGDPIPLRNGIRIIDIRDALTFGHVHLSQAEQTDFKDLLDRLPKKNLEWQTDAIYVICAHGNRSRVVASLLRKHDVKAYSIQGGMLEWSRLNLPRWRPEICRAIAPSKQNDDY